jgi:hypothetical protein
VVTFVSMIVSVGGEESPVDFQSFMGLGKLIVEAVLALKGLLKSVRSVLDAQVVSLKLHGLQPFLLLGGARLKELSLERLELFLRLLKLIFEVLDGLLVSLIVSLMRSFSRLEPFGLNAVVLLDLMKLVLKVFLLYLGLPQIEFQTGDLLLQSLKALTKLIALLHRPF